jgi:hypothetical protein
MATTNNPPPPNTNTRIPPPPLLPAVADQNNNNNNNVAATAAPFSWILRVRCPRGGGGGGTSNNNNNSWNNLATIKINVTPEMTSTTLGRCIGQAVASYSNNTTAAELDHVAVSTSRRERRKFV